ncbi:ABC transporter ATP-binding protein [Rhodospirillaceae bacterium KN72]|uniref:ABC transporter ATP-binding protein n=1 Tax=Pacificispira spongiicola TaxID=2729598 RepID=A0A7Y0E3V6_9PROT|nr:ABC transporter ATP-binding protein [Pacificispira spongiicola]NMM46729.1 ABC transporter ATP-binding protein [Pacificispira spongiicola]
MSTKETSITLNDVTIEFPVYDADRNFRKYLLKPNIGGIMQAKSKKAKHTAVTALRSLSCHFETGDRIGLIGLNGAGKSTLLHTLAGIYEPIGGELIVNGRVSTLFNTNIGIDPDDTGYRNILTCGLILGMTLPEIRRKLDEIIEFTELQEYIYLPVRTYSSGMLTRLAFAVATSIEPDILLMDENIGAGDASFQAKAAARIRNITSKAQILVLASHSESVLREFCNKAMFLHKGELIAQGDLETVLAEYNRHVAGTM